MYAMAFVRRQTLYFSWKGAEADFDFSKTGFMDSSGIGILLGRYKRMHHMGGEVLVTGEDAKIRRLLRISGVYQVVGTL